MNFSITSSSIPGSLEDKLRAAASAGFSGIEIVDQDLLLYDRSPEEVRQMLSQFGLRTTAFHSLREFEGAPDTDKTRKAKWAEGRLDLAQSLGTDLLILQTNTSPQASNDEARILQDICWLADCAAERNIRIAVEAVTWAKVFSRLETAYELVRQGQRENLGLVLDSCHFFSQQQSIDAID